MNCIECEADITPTAKFCPNCGAATVRACGHCGVFNPTTAKFCRECGASQSSQLDIPEFDALHVDDKPLTDGGFTGLGGSNQKSNLDGSEPSQPLATKPKAGRMPVHLLILGGLLAAMTLIMIVRNSNGKQRQELGDSSIESTPLAVPVVECKPDGEIKQLDGQTISSAILSISPSAAQQLAYLEQGSNFGILVPRNWYCFASSGSSGSVLYLAPERINEDTLSSQDWKGFAGPVIAWADRTGGTSGRFDVAQAIIRAFPAHMSFARAVIAEGIQTNLPSGPSATDKLTYFNNEYVEFHTPENTEGLGTDSGLQKNGSPISGVAILQGQDTDLLKLTVRLSPGSNDLAQVIVQQFERHQEGIKLAALMGTRTDFATVYAKAYGSGLEIGKRYVFTARVHGDLTTLDPPFSISSEFIGGDHDFDDSTQLEAVIKQAVNTPEDKALVCNMVVSMSDHHRILFHRAENCFLTGMPTYRRN